MFARSLALATALVALPGAAQAESLSNRFIHALQRQLEEALPAKPDADAGPAAAGGPSVATGFSHCKGFFAQGVTPRIPAALKATRELCFDAFAVLHSGQTRTPVFVAEHLTRAQLRDAQDEERTDRFFADARLPRAERAELDDYRGSGYDRGHMAPAGDMPTAQAMAQSFSLANMVPQAPENNRGVWAKAVERATRQFVMRAGDDVFVVTGPVFTAQSPAIGPDKVRVPAYLYKLVYDASENRAWAYWVENSNSARMTPPISYPELVRRTGIEFLPGLHPADRIRGR
ncbi:MAG: DNA/RNA non-specific endonuclease [Zoogloea sp.]|nr:DNA/RNA non-specific endonuclease [Zoogloea sp.]